MELGVLKLYYFLIVCFELIFSEIYTADCNLHVCTVHQQY